MEIASLIIAILSFVISVLNMLKKSKDKEKKYAPVLEINQNIYTGSLYSFHYTESQEEQQQEEFILDRRLFETKKNTENNTNGNVEKTVESHYSLIVDTSMDEIERIEAIGFDKLVIRNVGYSLSKITIKSIEFQKNNNIKVLEKSQRNFLSLNMRQNDEISLFVSGRFGKNGYQPFNVKKLIDDNGEYEKKLSAIKGSNLLNTRCISEADNWNKIKVILNTQNLYGDEYTQTVEFSISNNTYYMTVSEPKYIRKNIFQKL